MKKENVIAKLMLASVFMAFFFISSCKKDNMSAVDSTANYSAIAQTEDENASMDNAVGEAFMPNSGSASGRIADDDRRELRCATVTVDHATSTITITFNNCVGRNGHVRNGQIIIQYHNGGYWTPGASWDETFNNYTVDGVKITGSRHVENRGPAGIGMTWHIVVDLTFTRPDGSVRTWTSTRDRVLKDGFDLDIPFGRFFDAVYVINGTASYSDSKTGAIVGITIKDVTRDLSCRYITAGTLVLAPKGGINTTINFGDGTCDDIATVTSGNVIKVIHLHKRFHEDKDE